MANKAISTLAVGSSVYLNVGGVRTEFLVVHQGLPSSMYDSSCDGTWLLMKDIYENRAWHSSNVNNLENSTIHSYLNSTFLNLFDSNIRDAIKQVKLPYRKNGGSGGTDQSGANGLSAKIFLLSGYEVGWTTSDNSYFPVDGAKLDYFGASSGGNSKRIAKYGGAAASWWLRSPYTYYAGSVWRVSASGNYYRDSASNSYGIRPALVLPSTTLVDDSGNVVTVDLTAHKTLVNGTAYTVQGGKCMVDGTVYNILKGRTLIDGTGWDIALPEPLVMPVKGDLITMNLDGTDRLYRVLKIVDGTTVEVLGMTNLSSQKFSSGYNTYAGETLDTYLNTTWYNTLSSAAKSAIVPKDIAQDSWYENSSGSPVYSGTNNGGTYTLSLGTLTFKAIGNRYVYAMSIQEILDYLNELNVRVDKANILTYRNLWNLFWGTTTAPATKTPVWLRSARARENDFWNSWTADGNTGSLTTNGASGTGQVRPAFQIDLSKIDFTIGGG